MRCTASPLSRCGPTRRWWCWTITATLQAATGSVLDRTATGDSEQPVVNQSTIKHRHHSPCCRARIPTATSCSDIEQESGTVARGSTTLTPTISPAGRVRLPSPAADRTARGLISETETNAAAGHSTVDATSGVGTSSRINQRASPTERILFIPADGDQDSSTRVSLPNQCNQNETSLVRHSNRSVGCPRQGPR